MLSKNTSNLSLTLMFRYLERNMAIQNEGKGSSSASFSFKLTSKTTNKKIINTTSSANFLSENSEKDAEDKDYVTFAEGKEIQSSKPKKETKVLVIPLIHKNKWRLQGAKSNEDDLEKEAAAEIMKELEDDDVDKNGDVVMPILMTNRLPMKNGETADEKYDISIRPNESTMEDYENIPITAFGTAMLRGMGWSEGKPIGLNNTGLCEPIEYIPRHKGLGLGAEKRMSNSNYKKVKKLGENTTQEDRYQPIVEKDGKVRHVKGISEEVKRQPKGFYPGSFVQILKGPHNNLYGKIAAVDEDNTRLSIKLTISGEFLNWLIKNVGRRKEKLIELSQYNSRLVDSEEHKLNGKNLSRKEKKENSSKSYGEHSSKRKKEEHNSLATKRPSEPCWMVPNIRVRIISKIYRKGKCYNKKVKILDVVSAYTCTCLTDEKELLEDVHQNDIETIIPKSEGSYVMIVGGKYKNQLGKLMERNRKEEKATVQLTSNKHITNIRYDFVSEFDGELPDDELL